MFSVLIPGRVSASWPELTVGARDDLPEGPLRLIVSITEPGEALPQWALRRVARGERALHLTFSDTWAGLAGHPARSMSSEQMRLLLSQGARLEPGERVHVHCHAGRSRSAACAAALLMAAQPRRSERDILREVRRVRPQAEPNPHVLALADEHSGRQLARSWARWQGR